MTYDQPKPVEDVKLPTNQTTKIPTTNSINQNQQKKKPSGNLLDDDDDDDFVGSKKN